MARQIHPPRDDLAQLLQEIAQHFAGAPLAPVGDKLREVVAEFRAVRHFPSIDAEHETRLIASCRLVLANIPRCTDIGNRFWFDSNMILAIRNEWQACQLPPSIIARVGKEWQHSRAPLPSFDPERIPSVDLIDFPGKNKLDAIALLAYPWLYHELGHLVMRLKGDRFDKEVGDVLDASLQDGSHSTLGAAEAVRNRIAHLMQKGDLAWRPVRHRENWSHEIAIDCIALWSSGPTFIAAYDDAIEGSDPFILEDTHPPYEIRTFALVEAARRLGWDGEVAQLSKRLDAWEGDERRSNIANEYAALFNKDLVETIVSAALRMCDELKLPRCDRASVEHAKSRVHTPGAAPFGLPVLLAAWHEYQRDPNAYHEWEAASIRAMIACVKP